MLLITQHPKIDITPYLSDNLRYKRWRGHPHPLRGHCYVACEVLFHLFPGDWKPMHMHWSGESHWFLRAKRFPELILDPTNGQFRFSPDYSKGKGKGFLTKNPSKRARIVLASIDFDGKMGKITL